MPAQIAKSLLASMGKLNPEGTAAAPLVRKPNKKRKSTTKTFKVPEVIPGVPHMVEGFKPPSVTTYEPGAGYLRRGGKDEDYSQASQYTFGDRLIDMKNRVKTKKQKKEYKKSKAEFKKRQEARSRIKPIADPEAGKEERRRRARRRQMRGRLGTMLSERETLGSRTTVG